MVIHHARLPNDEDLFAPYDVIGQLGTRPIPVHVARQSALAVGGAQLVIAEHFPGACKTGNGAARNDLRREARRISTLANPHLARVREVAVRGDDLVVFGDFIDGEKLSVFWRPGEWLPLEIALRTLLDVLTGLGALHGLRDSNQQPMKLIHGEISPSTVLFGADGVARVLHAVARRAADATAEAASTPYLAPEVHTNDANDGRADVFSVGVLLWEILEGKCLSDDGQEPAGLRVRSGPLPAPSFPEKAPWAKALVPVAVKALAAAPEDRWATAAAMAAEIRKAAGLKLAAASAAAAFAKSKFGERVKERRAQWESRPSRPPGPIASPRPDAAGPPAPVFPALPAPLTVSSSETPALPPGRSEEFSSSVLESFMPPPPVPASPEGAPATNLGALSFAAKIDAPAVASPVAPAVASPVAPAIAKADAVTVPRAEPHAVTAPLEPIDLAALVHDDAAELLRGAAPPAVAPGDSALSIPPLEVASPASIPGPPSSAEAPLPFEAPVVFDEADVGPVASPLGEVSPMPPALSTSDAPVGSRSRRRHLIFGGIAALGIAAASVVAVRGSHHAPSPSVASVEAVAAAAPALVPPAVASATPTQPAVSVASPASPAPPSSVAATHGAGPKPAKAGPKTKPPAGGSHPKSGPVRPQTRSKPAST